MSVLSVADLRPGRTPGPTSVKAPALTALPKVHRRGRGLLAGVILLLLIALGAVLIANIHVANNQYRVVQMQNDYQGLVHENEALTQQVQHRESPQLLSSSAMTLGMVLPASPGTLDLANSELVSGAEAASSDERPSTFVAAPGALGTDATAAVDVADQAEGSLGGLLGVGALHTLTAPGAGQNSTDSDAAGGSGAAGDAGSTAEQSEGGTIPAPGLN